MTNVVATRTYRLVVDNAGAIRELRRTADGVERTNRQLERTQRQLSTFGSNLRNAILGGGIAFALVRLTQGFTALNDQALELNQRLVSIARGNQAGAAIVLERLNEVSQRLGVSVTDLSGALQRFRVAVPNVAVTDLIFSLETVSQVLVTTGASTQATNAVLLQLSQALGAGALRGDEFRSVLENAPVLLQAWAAAAGRAGESLVQLRDENFFTAESFFEFAQGIRDSSEEAIGLTRPADTLSRALVRIRSALVVVAVEFNAAISDGGPLAQFAQLLNRLALDGIPALLDVFLALADIVGQFGTLIANLIGPLLEAGGALRVIGEEADNAGQSVDALISPWQDFFAVALPASIEVALDAFRKFAEAAFEVFLLPGRAAAALVRDGFDGIEQEWRNTTDRLLKLTEDFDRNLLESFASRRSGLVQRVTGRQNLTQSLADFGLGGAPGGFRSPSTGAGRRSRGRTPRPNDRLLAAAAEEARNILQLRREFASDQRERTLQFEQELELIGLTAREQALLRVEYEQEAEVRELLLQQQELLVENRTREAQEVGLLVEQLQGLTAQRQQEAATLFDTQAREQELQRLRDAAVITAGDIGSVFQQAGQRMASAISDGTESISQSFRDMVKSILQQIAQLLAQSAVSQFAQLIFGVTGIGPSTPILGTGGGGGLGGNLFGSFFSGLFGGGGSSSTPAPVYNNSYQSVVSPYSSGPEFTPSVSVVNNGAPLAVQSTTASGGNVQVVVDTAVAQSEQRYQRSLRTGYGSYAEGINDSTTARRRV